MNDFISEITGKKVLIFGLGRQGGGAGDRDWLASHGAIVKVSDKDTTLCPEGQTKEQIDWADLIIKNPAVSDDHELILLAKSQGKSVYTSVAIFVKYVPLTTIGVTGTRGKSTTVGLITSLLELAFPGLVISGGNIAGTSCLSLFDLCEGKKYAVLELSSFQLHNFHDLQVSPDIAVITNLYPDHLNRYPSMDEYQSDKEAIVKYQSQTDFTLYNLDNPGAIAISRLSPGQLRSYTSATVADWPTMLPGTHNRENLAAMLALAQVLLISEDLAHQVARDFAGVPFRQQVVAVQAGVTYINDTTATTPIASVKALEAMTQPTIWITGGESKNLPFQDLITVVAKSMLLKKIIILGSAHIPEYVDALKAVASSKIAGQVDSMEKAVSLAQVLSASGDAVLLSPGFASFDLFQNEFDRGRQFNQLVSELKK